ncbi:MAG: flagellar type III secretion system pore protein FliP [Phycisphaerae bacterium]|nr:flagellar type III secretion system pore protein FliP [Phycisphaerales bacterium]
MFFEHGCSNRRLWLMFALITLVVVSATSSVSAQTSTGIDNPAGIPDLRGVLPTADSAKGVTSTLQILVLMTVLTLVPALLVLMTSFTRIIVVLALLRQALATPQLPPSQVLLGLSMFITIAVMAPTFDKVYSDAVTPYLNKELSQREALDIGMGHMRDFMYRQIEASENHEDIYLFEEYRRGAPIPEDQSLRLADVKTTSLIPAFILSELKTAFVMGFRIYLPFLVIDMVIASILISMGMMMLPPVLISLPFKLLLFVLADGWHLIVQSLLYSFM